MRSNDKPNILIIVIDSLRADHVSCYGYHRETTPNMDRIAAEGCLFETAITAAPFSPASYASLFSNLYPHQHGVNGDTVRVWPDTWPRLPELMKSYGYSTFCVTNNSFVTRATNGARGFDAFVDIQEPTWFMRQHDRALRRIRRYLGERVANRLSSNHRQCMAKGNSRISIERVGQLMEEAGKPFFGLVILMDPHTPYNKFRIRFLQNRVAARRFFRQRNGRTMWTQLMAARGRLSDTELATVRDLYDSEIHHADSCISMLRERLSQCGQLDRTILAVTSDHGEAFGERGVWGHGFCLNDCLTRVPLVLRHPAYWSAGARCSRLVQLHDLHELCLSVADSGTPRPREYPHCLTQAGAPGWKGREVAFSEFPRQSKTLRFMHERNPEFAPGIWDHDMWAVRSTDWRYIEYDDGQCELFDLRADPGETVSVHADRPDVADEFGATLRLHRNDKPYEQRAGRAPQVDDDVVVERLRALGYIE